jgi:N-acetylmuramoyl-L-alanine amidase
MFSRRFDCFIGLALLVLASAAPPAWAGPLSPLAPRPDWAHLDAYQRTITRSKFTRLVDQVYSPDGDFWKYVEIDDAKAVIYSDLAHKQPLFTLHFAPDAASCAPLPYKYKTQADSHDPTRPLKGIRIALDPGHIGGDWAKLEARYFKLGDDPPVEEATLNMITCQLLAERLQADGADIVWAKHGYEPTTDLRPDSLHREAIASLSLRPGTTKRISGKVVIQRMIDEEAALLFYRVAEIRARADLVNSLHPDLTICVHYNADDWGDDPAHPVLTANSRLVIFVNGAYERSELVYDDMKYDLLRKLLDRDAVQEERGCADVGQAMLDTLGYPPESYTGGYFARHVTDVPSVFARNLMASRLYHGPVIYCEGPYMNARDAYYRIIAGDYLGLRTIQGRSVPSIYRQYAASVEKGVLKYFGVK